MKPHSLLDITNSELAVSPGTLETLDTAIECLGEACQATVEALWDRASYSQRGENYRAIACDYLLRLWKILNALNVSFSANVLAVRLDPSLSLEQQAALS